MSSPSKNKTGTKYLLFLVSGISMSINRRDKGFTFFTFDHSRQYQRMRRESIPTVGLRMRQEIITAQDAQKNLHVEELIEVRRRARPYTALHILKEGVHYLNSNIFYYMNPFPYYMNILCTGQSQMDVC